MQCVQLFLGNLSVRIFFTERVENSSNFPGQELWKMLKKYRKTDAFLMWMVMNTGRKYAYPASKSASSVLTANHGKKVTLKMFD